MNNAELREAIKQTSEHIHFLTMKVAPNRVESECKPFREHLSRLLAIEVDRLREPVENKACEDQTIEVS